MFRLLLSALFFRLIFFLPFIACLSQNTTLLFAIACNAPAPTPPPPAANPTDLAIAPTEYADLSKKALEHLTKFEFDAWGAMLADTAQYNFPNGDEQTRTKLTGKQAVLDWWKNWQQTSGIQSMTTDRLNQYSLDVAKSQLPGGLTGIFSYAYFSNKMVFNGTPVSVRMNFIAHFNQDKRLTATSPITTGNPSSRPWAGKIC